MVLAAGAIDWNLGRFTDGVDKYTYAVERDPRLLDDKYLEVRCWRLCMCVSRHRGIDRLRQTSMLHPPPADRPAATSIPPSTAGAALAAHHDAHGAEDPGRRDD